MSVLVEGLFRKLETSRSLDQLLDAPMQLWRQELGISSLVLLQGAKGAWKKVLHAGDARPEPPDWNCATECLDSQRPLEKSIWNYFHIPSQSHVDLVLCTSTDSRVGSDGSGNSLEPGIGEIAYAIDLWQRLQQRSRDVIRLNQILNVSADWHAHQDLDRLLQDIAQAATRLLKCDRASIFLWDRATKELVGHPALGIENKPLRIADDKGVAGAVLKSLEPRRWDRSDPRDEVDRRVDTSSGYRTDSLLAVPLLDQRGKAIGVFEVINHADGKFDLNDQDDLIELARHAAAALSNTQQRQQLVAARDRLTRDAVQQVQLIGESPEMKQLASTIERVGNTDLAVLILGENGTGKEVVSRQIHYQSPRKFEPFIAVNCAAITETLLESELFGHEKGAFTDAHETRSGKFELASGGTLFLDEIGDMSLAGQAKLLRVLEEKVVVRVGGSTPIPVNVRVIAATNQNLVDLVERKLFREDLYFRLTVVTINLPSLRNRGHDVMELADFFLTMFCDKIGRRKPTWSEDAQKRLLGHNWPGNVRELRNIIERIAYLSTGDVIEDSHIDFVRSPRSQETSDASGLDLNKSLADATADFQTKYIEEQIKACNRNISMAATRMGLQRTNLYRKMKQLGMKADETT
ncbi:sigma-54 interaction domain-containing protein [Pirellulaceae bacterium SH449]